MTQKVTLRAHRSVMIVRAYVPLREHGDLVPYRRVLVPLNGSQRVAMSSLEPSRWCKRTMHSWCWHTSCAG
jgi:hypothetical protein